MLIWRLSQKQDKLSTRLAQRYRCDALGIPECLAEVDAQSSSKQRRYRLRLSKPLLYLHGIHISSAGDMDLPSPCWNIGVGQASIYPYLKGTKQKRASERSGTVYSCEGQAALLRLSSTTTPNTRDSPPGQDTHDDFKPQVVWLLASNV